MGEGGGFKCVHDTGRTGNCHCYCGYKGSSPSDPANDHIAMIRKGHPNFVHHPLSNAGLRTAVRLWRSDRAAALAEYGPIEQWDTSEVTDMSNLFKYWSDFNENISAWDTSKVTSMQNMFFEARAFNKPIGAWDTSKVTDMRLMFLHARAFNQPIGAWDTSKVTNMGKMFIYAVAFDQPIGAWDTSKVTNMKDMFREVSSCTVAASGPR